MLMLYRAASRPIWAEPGAVKIKVSMSGRVANVLEALCYTTIPSFPTRGSKFVKRRVEIGPRERKVGIACR